MRLFLDAHLSGRNIGQPLRAQGHDVRAADAERQLDRAGDESLLRLATDDGRILITHNTKDILRILARWGAAGTAHAGCRLVPHSFRQDQYGVIIAGIAAALAATPEQEGWSNRVEWLARAGRG
jgi:hypothetical protein